jgi:hypothetical protein
MAPETSAETLARALAMKATHHFRDQPDAYRSAGTSAAESSGDNALCCSLMLYELAEQCKVRPKRQQKLSLVRWR